MFVLIIVAPAFVEMNSRSRSASLNVLLSTKFGQFWAIYVRIREGIQQTLDIAFRPAKYL
jgi:hypothetical protein